MTYYFPDGSPPWKPGSLVVEFDSPQASELNVGETITTLGPHAGVPFVVESIEGVRVRARRDEEAMKRRGGFTIVELLVVIGIMLALTAMAIPLLAPSREERRVTEATRIVTSMFAGARARAIETGKPCGVMLEVDPTNTARCLTLSYAEVPPMYAGGFTFSRVVIEGEPFDDLNGNGSYDLADNESWTDWNGNGFRDSGGFITAFVGNDGSSLDTSWLSLIRPGDSLRVNHQGFDYVIGLPSVSQANVDAAGYITALGPNAPWELATVRGGTLAAAGAVVDAVTPPHTSFIAIDGTPVTSATRFTSGTHAGGRPFQIVRSPQPSAAKTETLPETMCIDLYASSTAADSISLLGAGGNVTIMYSPGGAIETMRWSTGAVTVPHGPVFLLIGKTALVGGNIAPKPVEPVYNWQDLDAKWLMINHQSGLLASNPVATVDTTDAVDDQIRDSREHAYTGIKIGDK